LSDTGVDDDFMKRLGEEFAPGKAEVIVLVRRVSVDKVLPEIKVSGTVIQTSLSNEDEQKPQQALDAARAQRGGNNAGSLERSASRLSHRCAACGRAPIAGGGGALERGLGRSDASVDLIRRVTDAP
jgi:hypothetical protein